MTKCSGCDAEVDVEPGPGRVVTCWDCAVRETPALAALEGELQDGFDKFTEGYICVDGSWERKQ